MRELNLISTLFSIMFVFYSGIALAQSNPSAESVPENSSSTESNNTTTPDLDPKMDIEAITNRFMSL